MEIWRLWVIIRTWRLQEHISHMSFFWYLIHLPWSMLKGSRFLDFTLSTAEFTDPRICFNVVWLYLCKSKLVFDYLRKSVSSCCPYLHFCFIKEKKTNIESCQTGIPGLALPVTPYKFSFFRPDSPIHASVCCDETASLYWKHHGTAIGFPPTHYNTLPMTRKRTAYNCFDVHDNCHGSLSENMKRHLRSGSSP